MLLFPGHNTFFGTHFLQASNLSGNSEEYECQFSTGKAFVVFLIQNSFSNKEHAYTKKTPSQYKMVTRKYDKIQ